ncbi:MAG: galactose-1-phosphate uridylyltransferase [Planctomycetota bacterium]
MPAPVWEQRWHPLREEWVVVAAHRQRRPWLGERRPASIAAVPGFDPACRFCPGNERVGGTRNPRYARTLVFNNDLPVVGEVAPVELVAPPPPYRVARASGVARIVCYTPRHDQSLARLPLDELVGLLRVLAGQYAELGAREDVAHVLVFENRGEVVGVSNPHPHCQIYATGFVFKTIETEVAVGRRHFAETGRVLLQDVLAAEVADGRRLLVANDAAVAFVPYFARYPYEVFVAPRATHPCLGALGPAELEGFASALQGALRLGDELWSQPFPYVMALHQAPTDDADHASFHFHIELHPPLRGPDLLKYPAGPEVGGGNFMSDVAPEDAAAELRGDRP